MSISENAIEARARRAARSVGLVARKSRWRLGSCDNYGEFMLTDERNVVVLGQRFDATPEEVIEYCKPE